MALPSIEEIAERTAALYGAESRLRAKEKLILDVILRRHLLKVPPNMRSRVELVYTDTAGERLERAKGVLIDDDGPQVNVTRDATSDRADRDRETVQEWFQGCLAALETRSVEGIENPVTEETLWRSRGWARVTPDPNAWSGAPVLDVENLDVDDLERRINQTNRRVEAYQRTHFPIFAEWVPAEGIFPSYNRHAGLAEVIEVQLVSAQEILDSYQDEEGKPLAAKLASAVDEADLTPRDLVTLVVRADNTHIQYGTISLLIDSDVRRQDSTSENIEDEIFYACEHGMGRVPYARFRGRERALREPVERYYGFLDSVAPLVENIDNALTQLGSSARWAAWPVMAVEQPSAALGAATRRGGDTPAVIQYVEGGILDLKPGQRITNPGWIDSASYQIHGQYIQALEAKINKLTFSDVVTGSTGAADSGYMYAQMDNNATSILNPWRTGLQHGWADLLDLCRRAACALMRDYDFDPIPVRRVGQEAATYVTLNQRLAEMEWDITVQIRTRPVGGEAALVQMLGQMQDRGWIDSRAAMERLGDRTASRTQERVEIEKLWNSGPVQQTLQEVAAAHIKQAFAEAALPNMPDTGAIPAAAAGQFTSPYVRARLPENMNEPVGMGSQGSFPGLPGVTTGREQNGHTPTLTNPQFDQMVSRINGGPPAGMAQNLPGGLRRQSIANPDLLNG